VGGARGVVGASDLQHFAPVVQLVHVLVVVHDDHVRMAPREARQVLGPLLGLPHVCTGGQGGRVGQSEALPAAPTQYYVCRGLGDPSKSEECRPGREGGWVPGAAGAAGV